MLSTQAAKGRLGVKVSEQRREEARVAVQQGQKYIQREWGEPREVARCRPVPCLVGLKEDPIPSFFQRQQGGQVQARGAVSEECVAARWKGKGKSDGR